MPLRDYWSELLDRLRFHRGGVTWFQGGGEMSILFWQIEGPFFSILALLTWVFILKRLLQHRTEQRDMLVLLFSLLPFVYFSGMKWEGQAYPRTLSCSLPIISIGIGAVIWDVQKYFQTRLLLFKRGQWLISTIVALIILVKSFPSLIQQGITRSGYSQASHFILSSGKDNFMFLTNEPIWRFYLNRPVRGISAGSVREELVKKVKNGGVRYIVIDYAVIPTNYWNDVEALFLRGEQPLAVFPNPRGSSFPYLVDEFGLSLSRLIISNPRSKSISIFRLPQDSSRA